jgi:hypothetical protein
MYGGANSCTVTVGCPADNLVGPLWHAALLYLCMAWGTALSVCQLLFRHSWHLYAFAGQLPVYCCTSLRGVAGRLGQAFSDG